MAKTPEQVQIGKFIETLRERAGMTQGGLAKELKTSQSAIARMENGEQNFTTEMLAKRGRAVGRDIITLSSGAMSFRIEGGRKLSGTVRVNTSKNSAVALLCASLLNRGKTPLRNMPKIEEVNRVVEVLQSIGVVVGWLGNEIDLTPPKKLRREKRNAASA